ncbi:hypothetical protein Tsp_14851 [Trichinella spiralis]|uniref:hypothetical protein n=1 Tax=Trichinella spiralis TaxID=6334 RepID=UPI0001EFDAA5|nr:hypothetical protein Tsp_14851 [Trichinella spiralis]
MDHTDNLANRKTRSPSARQNIRRQTRKHTTIDALHSSITPKCPVCRGDHRLPNCKRFLSQWLEERKKTARTLHPVFQMLATRTSSNRVQTEGSGLDLAPQADADNEKQPTPKEVASRRENGSKCEMFYSPALMGPLENTFKQYAP